MNTNPFSVQPLEPRTMFSGSVTGPTGPLEDVSATRPPIQMHLSPGPTNELASRDTGGDTIARKQLQGERRTDDSIPVG